MKILRMQCSFFLYILWYECYLQSEFSFPWFYVFYLSIHKCKKIIKKIGNNINKKKINLIKKKISINKAREDHKNKWTIYLTCLQNNKRCFLKKKIVFYLTEKFVFMIMSELRNMFLIYKERLISFVTNSVKKIIFFYKEIKILKSVTCKNHSFGKNIGDEVVF